MYRLPECKPYRLREELEEVLEPWPVNVLPTRTLSELEVKRHGRHLPRTVPPIYSEEARLHSYRQLPLHTAGQMERQLHDEDQDAYKNEAIEEGMKVLQTTEFSPRGKLFDDVPEEDCEPDETYGMLDSENEARFRFEAFLKRMRLHFSEYGPTGDEIKYERPASELPPMRRDKKPPEPYYDKRCEDKRKMIPMVYEAPPYPEYWLLKKKPKVSVVKEAKLEGDDQI